LSLSAPDKSVGDHNAIARRLVVIFSAALTLGSLGWAADLYRVTLGLVFSTEQFLAGMLAIALPLLYLNTRAGPNMPKEKVPWYDWVFAIIGLFCGAYMAVRYTVLSELITERPNDGLIAGGLLIALVIEGLRRTVGWILVAIVLLFLAYTQLAGVIPGALQGRPAEFSGMIYYMSWDAGSMLGLPMTVGTTVVISFLFFGNLLFRSGGSEFFSDISIALMGRFRGGSAKIAIVASGLFGSISGSAVSNVASTGVITIPLMRQGGYPPHVAGAIEAVASTGGQLMPPIMGAAAFIMATFLEVDYVEVVIAALLPAILYYMALFIQTDLEAARSGITQVPEHLIPRVGRVLLFGWHYVLAFVVLIAALFWLNREPETAALYASGAIILSGLFAGYKKQRMPLKEVWNAVTATGIAALDILMICAAAGLIIGVLNLTGLGFALTLALVQVASGSLFLLLLLAGVVCIVLGMGMPTAGVYVLLAALVAPAIIEAGVDPMAAHLYVLYFGMMSMITPPVAIAAFTAASIAKCDPMRTGFAAVRFGWIAYVVPFLFISTPALLMKGTPLEIAYAMATAVAGVWLISTAITGYMFRSLDIITRIGVTFAGVLLLMPENIVLFGEWSNPVGLGLGAAVSVREFLITRAQSAVSR
jgi:TRAP transporter 4TM/12TM fusion protein